jgi:hypothetical protein
MRAGQVGLAVAGLALTVSPALAQTAVVKPVYVFGIPVDFILFALTLIGVALFHHKTLQVAPTGSFAGVALSNMYPEARSVGSWVKNGWHVALAYVFGFFVMLAILGWKPDAPHKKQVELPVVQVSMGAMR